MSTNWILWKINFCTIIRDRLYICSSLMAFDLMHLYVKPLSKFWRPTQAMLLHNKIQNKLSNGHNGVPLRNLVIKILLGRKNLIAWPSFTVELYYGLCYSTLSDRIASVLLHGEHKYSSWALLFAPRSVLKYCKINSTHLLKILRFFCYGLIYVI